MKVTQPMDRFGGPGGAGGPGRLGIHAPQGTPGGAAADPSIERTLRRLELTVTRRLDGLLLGDHLGLMPGSGTEKAESRTYHIGDDVRRMDWAVTARTTVPHVHDLVADRELETWVLVDLTASLEFGTSNLEKRDLAIAAVAAVGYLTARSGNRLGALVLTTGSGPRLIPARTGRDGLRALLRTLLASPRTALDRPSRSPGGATTTTTDLAAAVDGLRNPPRRRGMAVVISDFLSVDMSWERPLRALAGRHQVLAIEIVDPRELELPNVGLLDVVDPETGATLSVPTSSRRLRDSYARAAAAHRREVDAALRRAGAGHLVLRTDSDWLTDIVRFVLATRRTRGAARRPPVAPRPTGAGR
ncbi:hypothetical protein FDG2_4717 [Candidatus Protofrankia californiensis]|uniref:DUF58 domain-containing protein n=2 Tax=Protofrankia TaxID=2994361 RepID=A0A1C3P7S4_9ACTN|nr:hypothetical protein FDG2_4717 [Candidatus Protofrankia californiensis]